MFFSLYDEVKNVMCVSLLSHDRYQYDSLGLSKQTWAYTTVAAIWFSNVEVADVVLTSRNDAWKKNFNLSSTLLRKLWVHYADGFDTT